jgi:dipeptidyl aminopeptidase/acylaminoacyl peptidase
MTESGRRTLTPTDLLSFTSVRDAQISPDGQLVAFVAGESVKVDTRSPKSRIWLVPTAGGAACEFTTGPRSETSPRWSPDGQTLAFFSDRLEDGKAQVYLLPRDGGEARLLATPPGDLGAGRGSDSLQWSPDGKSLAILIRDPESEAEKERTKEKNDAIELEEHPRFTRLWLADVATAEARAITPAGVQVWECSWAPDGTGFALLVSDSPEEWSWYHARIATVAATGGALTDVYSTRRQMARPIISPNGRQIAFVEAVLSDRGIVAGDLLVVPTAGGAARNLTDGARFSVGEAEWSADGQSLLACAAEDAGTALYQIDVASGRRRQIWSASVGIAEASGPRFSRARDGSLAVVREDTAHPREVWFGQWSGETVEWRQLTSLNARSADFALPEVESIRWRAPDGWELQGFLLRPLGYEAGRRYPLVTWVHGGPTGVYNARFFASERIGLLASNGIAVFLPNPRGSTGWGRAFAEANVGDMGGEDLGDILAGIDSLVERGVADADRLGIGGWSYGGFMTAWSVTQTTRFKAALMGAGITSWRSFHGSSHLADWDAIHYAADPYERGGTFDKFSPINFIKNVKTPTLIVHGERDRDVPVSQGYEFYRALKDLGIETRFVIYPREGHGFSEKNHVLDLAQRTIDWFKAKLT